MKTNRTANVVTRSHAFIQNLRRGSFELAVDAAPIFRLATGLTDSDPLMPPVVALSAED